MGDNADFGASDGSELCESCFGKSVAILTCVGFFNPRGSRYLNVVYLGPKGLHIWARMGYVYDAEVLGSTGKEKVEEVM